MSEPIAQAAQNHVLQVEGLKHALAWDASGPEIKSRQATEFVGCEGVAERARNRFRNPNVALQGLKP